MAQLLDISGFISVLLRGFALSLETLTVGGVLFLLLIARAKPVYRLVPRFAMALAIVQTGSLLLNSAILISTTGMSWSEVIGAGYFIAGSLAVLGAVGVGISGRTSKAAVLGPLFCCCIVAGSVMSSHSVARLEQRWAAIPLTAAHHVAGAVWIGGLLYLVLALRERPEPSGVEIAHRFSRAAVISVATLIGAGAGLGALYVGSPAALIGSTYGIMLLSKIVLTGLLLLLGALNFRIVRACRAGSATLLPLRRFAEAELGLGFTILLAAASLTSTTPAIDVRADRVTAPEIVQRMRPHWPKMETPAFADLSPALPLAQNDQTNRLPSFLPGQQPGTDSPADIAWSEYNHHWAGLVVLAIGILSLLARRVSWARSWPLAFIGLAIFLFIRADAENWPLGPRGFWESFQVAEVAQHRLFVALIVVFAVFEWSVQTGRLAAKRAGLVFPLVCAVGGALLLTHSHFVNNVRKEYFAEMSHIPLAVLGAVAGWSRWLDIRLPASHRQPVMAWVWPVCFVLVGVILIAYREI
jgi:putative copper resistance protein D